MSNDRTFAAAGDAIITRRLSTVADPSLDALLERIRGADVSLVNLEVLLHDYEGYPAAQSGGTYMRAPRWAADELTWAGFDVFVAANNHTLDYSHGGLESTMRALEDRDIPYAGVGRTLAQAREPAYVDGPTGRVGVVAACSTITTGSAAGRQRSDVKGRPGLAPLALDTRFVVPESVTAQLTDLSEALGLEGVKESRAAQGFPVPGEDDEGFAFLNPGGEHLQFVAGGDDEYRVERTPSEADREAYLDRVRDAAAQSGFVVASLHAHEGEGAYHNDHSVPDWLQSFARDCVDAGADVFVGHGPHVLRGVELYEGAPIFYSLGDFLMQNETVSRLPADIYERYDLDPHDALPSELFDARVFDEDGARKGFLSDRAFWESVVPVASFDDDGLTSLELYPVDLGYEEGRGDRGRPRLATDDTATRILEELASLSEPFGTAVEVEDDVGVVEP